MNGLKRTIACVLMLTWMYGIAYGGTGSDEWGSFTLENSNCDGGGSAETKKIGQLIISGDVISRVGNTAEWNIS